MRDILGTPNVQGIVKFLHLIEIINTQVLLPQEEDQIIWRLSASGKEISILDYVCRHGRTTDVDIDLERVGRI